MAKIYINTVKYQIVTDFEIGGIVDKHDIIGAVFGQSEGLLGDDLDLRELQKSGKIGRIEVDAKTMSGKTVGKILIPSSMDMVQTSLLAASIESVDKVGPCDSMFKTEKISDMRETKRKNITDRAKEILKSMVEKMPETQELTEGIRHGMRSAEIVELGPEKLPAGPDARTSEEIILVEGRADVLTLLKYGIKNVIGMDGSKIPQSLPALCRGKRVILFTDGDRGGEIILRNVSTIIKIDGVARAPDGKEVEELTQKEILGALRKRVEARIALSRKPRMREDTRPIRAERPMQRKGIMKETIFQNERPEGRRMFRHEEQEQPLETIAQIHAMPEQTAPAAMPSRDIGPFSQPMKEIENTLKAKLIDEKMHTIKEINVRDLLREMGNTPNIHAVVFDGIVTKRLVEEAVKNSIKFLVGVKKGKIEETENVKVLTLN